MTGREQLVARLDSKRARLATLEVQYAAARVKSGNATPGGLDDYDPAILSGIRRKPDHKADERRWNAYRREGELAVEIERTEREIKNLEHLIAELNALPEPPSLEEIKAARAVRNKYGWHRVVRVNAKSVTVATGFSWTDRIPLTEIIEARA